MTRVSPLALADPAARVDWLRRELSNTSKLLEADRDRRDQGLEPFIKTSAVRNTLLLLVGLCRDELTHLHPDSGHSDA